MKRILIGVLIVCLAVLTGCIKQETTFKVNPDGSGTIEETIGIKEELIEMFGALNPTEHQGNQLPAEAFEKTIEGQAKNKAKEFGEGVEFKELKKEEKDNMVYYTAAYSFEDIAKIKIAMLGTGPINAVINIPGMIEKPPGGRNNGGKDKAAPPEMTLFSFEFKRQEDDSTRLTIKNSLEKTLKDMGKQRKEAPFPPGPPPERKEGEIEETEPGHPMPPFPPPDKGRKEMTVQMEMMKLMLKDTSFSVVLVCGETISGTDATYVEGNKITLLNIDFNKIRENEAKLKEFVKITGTPPEDPIKALESLKEFGIKMELKETVTVEFK